MTQTDATADRVLRQPAIRDIDWVAARFGHQ
jgi:hypothetical protein